MKVSIWRLSGWTIGSASSDRQRLGWGLRNESCARITGSRDIQNWQITKEAWLRTWNHQSQSTLGVQGFQGPSSTISTINSCKVIPQIVMAQECTSLIGSSFKSVKKALQGRCLTDTFGLIMETREPPPKWDVQTRTISQRSRTQTKLVTSRSG